MRLAFSFMRAGLWEYRSGEGVVFGCLVGWLCFSPVASRVSARQPSYFFLLRQKKVTKKKASHVRAASRSLALLAAFGALANSLRSNSASAFIRTLLRCSARPNGGGYLSARPLRELRPKGWFAALTSRGLGLPHFSTLTAHMGTARRALTPNPLIPHASLLIMGNHKGCPYTPHSHSSLLTPHSSFLIPHSSLLIPHSSFLIPHSSLLAPHSSLLTPTPSLLTPTTSLLTPSLLLLTPLTKHDPHPRPANDPRRSAQFCPD